MIGTQIETLYLLLKILLGIFLGMSGFVFIKKNYERIIKYRNIKILKKYEGLIQDYILEGAKDHNIPHELCLRDYLLSLCKLLNGPERERIIELYESAGFYEYDLKALKSIRYRKRVRALNRLLLLGKRLEIETLESLLIDEHLVFRWMALDLYIQTYNDKAFVPLLKFIQDERNLEYRGVLFQLMAKYANLKIQDLIFMLSHLPNEKLLEILLKVLEIYPVQEVKDIILNEVRGRSSIRVISSAIQILSNFPDERFFYLLKIYYQSSSIELRVRIAKILKNLDDERGVEILKKLTCDTDFFVRNEACYSLVELKNSSGNHYLRDIFEDPGHPSHKIINNIYSLRAFEEVA